MADDKPTKGIEFVAALPHTNTAIQVHGQDGMRITLDIPTAEIPNALGAVTLQGKLIRVRMEEA